VVLDYGVPLAAVGADGRRVALLGSGGEIRVWDVMAGRWLGPPVRPGGAVSRCAFSPDGERLVILGVAGPVRVCQVRTGEQVAAWPGHGAAARTARFSPDGRRVAAADGAGVVRVWDATTGRPLTPPLRHGAPMAAAAFYAGGEQVAAVSGDGTVSVWELAGPGGARGDAAAERVAPAAEVAGGRQLIKLKNGVTVRVPRAVTAARLRPPQSGGKTVDAAAFSPDGARVVVLTEDNTARVWDTATGALTPPLAHARVGQHALFGAGGNRAVVVHEGGAVSVWDLTPDARPVAELVALARVLACAHINESQHKQALAPHQLRAAWESLQQAR
jgi:WD40 repeat protein